MLWNPENDMPKTQPDELLVSLIDWLELQPKAAAYKIHDPETCMLGQYAAAMGYACPTLKSIELFDIPRLRNIVVTGWDKMGVARGKLTFGAALARARATAAGPKEN